MWCRVYPTAYLRRTFIPSRKGNRIFWLISQIRHTRPNLISNLALPSTKAQKHPHDQQHLGPSRANQMCPPCWLYSTSFDPISNFTNSQNRSRKKQKQNKTLVIAKIEETNRPHRVQILNWLVTAKAMHAVQTHPTRESTFWDFASCMSAVMVLLLWSRDASSSMQVRLSSLIRRVVRPPDITVILCKWLDSIFSSCWCCRQIAGLFSTENFNVTISRLQSQEKPSRVRIYRCVDIKYQITKFYLDSQLQLRLEMLAYKSMYSSCLPDSIHDHDRSRHRITAHSNNSQQASCKNSHLHARPGPPRYACSQACMHARSKSMQISTPPSSFNTLLASVAAHTSFVIIQRQLEQIGDPRQSVGVIVRFSVEKLEVTWCDVMWCDASCKCLHCRYAWCIAVWAHLDADEWLHMLHEYVKFGYHVLAVPLLLNLYLYERVW